MKKKIIAIVLASTVLLLLYFYLSASGNFRYNGIVEAVETNVSSRVSGTIKQYHVREGEAIKEGGLIAEIDSPETLLSYNLAKSNYERGRKLLSDKIISEETYDGLKYQYEQANLRLSWTKIVSPVNGKVIYNYHENGELVNPGSKIVNIIDDSRVNLYIYVPYRKMINLKTGMKVKAFLPELKDKEFEGIIIFINDSSEFTPKNVLTERERDNLVFQVKIRFDNPDRLLKSGMTLEAELP
ncbi:MAG: efflux RND transporter periplasmic adaptor subunit [Endomicrobia bacterium]|nr:efflux RND transporter periplasmic adaptor subunit [Endomicrobiia bacterium]MCL2798866.1 efflux RND transporter periplasmic adaptor subunit [Endomicrobiia bacterium]